MDIIKSQEQGRDVHEQFHDQLERTQDGFALVADYFARGVFNKVRYNHQLCPRLSVLFKHHAVIFRSLLSRNKTFNPNHYKHHSQCFQIPSLDQVRSRVQFLWCDRKLPALRRVWVCSVLKRPVQGDLLCRKLQSQSTPEPGLP